MVITLSGSNSYSLQVELQRLRNDFLASNSDLGLIRLDGEEAEFSQIDEALNSPSLFSPNKLVILRSPSKNKNFSENIEQILDNIADTTDVIIVESKPDKRLSYYKTLKKKSDLRDFSELDDLSLSRWAQDFAKNNQGQLSSIDAHYLVERVGLSQQIVEQELIKLLTYDPKISRATIDRLTEPTPQSTIFQLLEAAFAGRPKQTLDLYREQRALKIEPPQILAMLSWQLHILAVIKTAGQLSIDQIAKDAKISPFVLRKSQAIAKNLPMIKLKQLISDLLAIDIGSKQTNLNVDGALQNYLLKIASFHK